MDAAGAGADGGRRIDCHMHVFGPPQRFPLRRPPLVGVPPPVATADMLAQRCVAQDVGGGFVIHPVEYLDDTACLEEALATLGARFTGIIMAREGMDPRAFARLDVLGVKGLRLMFPARTGLAPSDATLAAAIESARRFGWGLRVLAAPDDWQRAAAWLLPLTDVPVVLEHLAVCAPRDARAGSPAHDALCALLCRPNVWLQLSGAARLAPEAEWPALAATARRHYDLCEGRCVWGSDWPHIGDASGGDAASLRFAEAVCASTAERQRLFSDEPQALLRGHGSFTSSSTGRAST